MAPGGGRDQMAASQLSPSALLPPGFQMVIDHLWSHFQFTSHSDLKLFVAFRVIRQVNEQ